MGSMYQVVDSPLSEYFDPYLPPRQKVASTNQLMLIILGFVAVVVITAVSLVPQMINGSSSDQTDAREAAVPSAVGESAGAGETAVAPIITGAGSISPIFSPQVQHWAPQIVTWANQFGLDPDIVATIMQIESCGDPNASSHAGAQGLFQVMPFHFTAGEIMLDPDTNARRGMAYFAERLAQTGGDVFQAFAGYNGGHVAAAGNWNTWANETQRYYTWSKGIYEDAKSGSSESNTLQQWLQAGGATLCQQASARLGLE